MTDEADTPCAFCGQVPATRLCDYILGRDLDVAHVVFKMNDTMVTCDLELCTSCAKVQGHTCGEDGCDTFDYCPYHASLDDDVVVRAGKVPGTRKRSGESQTYDPNARNLTDELINATDADAWRHRSRTRLRHGLRPNRAPTKQLRTPK